jgi:hypothetical protein
VTASSLASVLPANSYYYSGSGNVLEVEAANATWSHLNFADWQIYDGPDGPDFTLNDDCVSYKGLGDAEESIINAASGFTLENSTVYATNATTQSANGIDAGDDTVLDNDYIYNVSDALNIGDGTIENSYILTNANAPGAHIEPIYTGDNTVTINHNTLLNPEDQAATIFADTSTTCASHLTVTNNLLAGGGYVIYSCGNSQNPGSSSLDFSHNDLARCLGTPVTYQPATGGSTCGEIDQAGADTHGYWPNGGYFGVDTYTYCPGQANVTWTGNTWDDNGSTVTCT